jgi:hypothetical protein
MRLLVQRLSLFVLGVIVAAAPSYAWVYPEHRDIAVLSVQTLDAERRLLFEHMWSEARTGNETRLCEQAADATQGVLPECIDWAAMSAIAGDHSCSSKEMLDTIEKSNWILMVADVAGQLKVDLAQSASASPATPAQAGSNVLNDLRRQLESEAERARRTNALRVADVRLQRADPEYATRAGSNNAHFVLARPRTDSTAVDYLRTAVKEGAEINAVGVYTWYHLAALQQASRLARETLTPKQRVELTRAMLADEAFALHFMEDVYAAGHLAGTWGDVSQRKGTHDYYNEHGLEVTTWQGGSQSMVLLGDAHMRPEDAEITAATVRVSLEQLIDTAAGRPRKADFPYSPKAPDQPAEFDVCKSKTIPARLAGLQPSPEIMQVGVEVLLPMPVPSLGPGLGAMPRYRAELGRFLGVASTLDARYVNGGFTGLEDGNGIITGADLSVRAGFGLDGVLGAAGDGLIYFSLGFRADAPSTNKFGSTAFAQQGGTLTAAIPARSGVSARLRMPYYLVPGDLLLLSPMYFLAPKAYQNMAVTAANGGLIPWQLGWATRFGRFQFVLGREIGVAFYGLRHDDTMLAPSIMSGAAPRIVNFKSTYFDFPILEYRPYRAFDTTQTSQLILQLYYGLDIPRGGAVGWPAGLPPVDLQRVNSIGMRAVFDWRRYY